MSESSRPAGVDRGRISRCSSRRDRATMAAGLLHPRVRWRAAAVVAKVLASRLSFRFVTSFRVATCFAPRIHGRPQATLGFRTLPRSDGRCAVRAQALAPFVCRVHHPLEIVGRCARTGQRRFACLAALSAHPNTQHPALGPADEPGVSVRSSFRSCRTQPIVSALLPGRCHCGQPRQEQFELASRTCPEWLSREATRLSLRGHDHGHQRRPERRTAIRDSPRLQRRRKRSSSSSRWWKTSREQIPGRWAHQGQSRSGGPLRQRCSPQLPGQAHGHGVARRRKGFFEACFTRIS